MMTTVQAIKVDMGANRKVGRELPALLHAAGFDRTGLKILPVTSQDVPLSSLLSLAFDFRERLLKEAGAWDEEMAACFEALSVLHEDPDALLFVPIFVGFASR